MTIQLNIVACPTYLQKFTRNDVVAPLSSLSLCRYPRLPAQPPLLVAGVVIRRSADEMFEERVESVSATLKEQLQLYEAEQRTLQVLRSYQHRHPHILLSVSQKLFCSGNLFVASTSVDLAVFPATWLMTAASSPTPAQQDCAWLTLVRFSSVGRGPTSATEPSLQLDLESGTICQQTSNSGLVIQAVAEDVFIWSVGPKRSVNLPLTTV